MFTTRDVCAVVGCTYRQLDYWVRCGFVTPTVPAAGSGSRRMFDAGDVERVLELKRAADVRAGGLVNA